MKILFINSSLGSGGAERVLSTLANYFVANYGYSVSIATYNNTKDFYPLDEKIQRIHFGTKLENFFIMKIYRRMQRLIQIRKIVKENNPDIIMTYIVYTNLETLIATIGINKPKIVVEHSNYWAVSSKVVRILRIFLYKHASKVILLTHEDFNKYKNYLTNCVVIPNPIQLDCSNEETIRKKTILCVGRLNEVKQFDHAIYAFDKIIKKHPEYKLIILGAGKELNNLQRYCNQLNISDKVEFTGNVKNIQSYYKSSSIFVLSSKYEGFPMALGEAMLCGMAVVSYDCRTGPSEMIENGKSGILLEHNDKKLLAQEIIKLIENNSLREEIAFNAKKCMKDFSVANIAEKWKNLFERELKC